MNLKPIAPNQTEVQHGTWTVFYSYSTAVACCDGNGRCYRVKEKYSPTTSRHVNKWLEGRRYTELPQKDMVAMIEANPEYVLRSA